MGTAVRVDEPFRNSHMGNEKGIFPWLLNYTDFEYQPNPPNRSYGNLRHHRKNLCKMVVDYKLEMPNISYADPAIYAQIVMVAAFLVSFVLGTKRVSRVLSIASDDLRTKRNSIIYIGQIMFSIVALPFVCISLAQVLPDRDSYDTVDPNTYLIARGMIMTQSVLYLLELFYRVRVRLSLIAHHLLTFITVAYLYYLQTLNYTDLALKYGLVLLLLALTEQSLYVVLLCRNVGVRENYPVWWNRICHGANATFVASRLVVVTLMTMLLVQTGNSSDVTWQVSRVSFSKWIDHDNSWVANPTVVSTTASLLLLGILLSNLFAWKAMIHMARNTVHPELQQVSLGDTCHFSADDGKSESIDKDEECVDTRSDDEETGEMKREASEAKVELSTKSGFTTKD
jgi:hypothetical protein